MRSLTIILIGTLFLAACDRQSSPDGRSRIRDEKIQKEIDSLKNENRAILDSVKSINKQLHDIKYK